MKTGHSATKSRNNNLSPSSSSIATRTRKVTASASAPAATSRKRLRRLQRPLEDDDDDEIEEELSAGSSSSSVGERRKSRGEEKEAASEAVVFENPLCFVEFDGSNGHDAVESEPAILALVCDRDVEQHPLLSDEMDQLQFELEKQLAQAVCTQRKLRVALNHLTASTSGQTSSATSTTRQAASASANKRKHPKSQQFAKKPTGGSSTTFTSSVAAKRNRLSGIKDRRPGGHESTPSCSRSYYYAQQNHQMPDKFWSFVDQFTGHSSLTTTAEALRDLVRETDCDSAQSKAYYELPESKHAKRRASTAAHSSRGQQSSTTRGASSTASAAKTTQKAKGTSTVGSRRESSPADEGGGGGGRTLRARDASPAQSRKRPAASTPTSAPAAKQSRDNSRILQNGTAAITRSQNSNGPDKNGLSLGPLTERLVQALIEECGVDGDGLPDRNGQANATESKNGLSSSSNSKAFMKTLNLGNLKALENRIKKELIEQGLLDASDDHDDRKPALEHQELARRDSRASTAGRSSSLGQFEESADDDEVTAELKRRQFELLCVQRLNHERLTSLLGKVETQVDKVKKEDTLRAADDEVLELCARYYGVAPTSRKPANKKERDTLWKALKDREKAIQKLKSHH